jgi:hypothetical protein
MYFPIHHTNWVTWAVSGEKVCTIYLPAMVILLAIWFPNQESMTLSYEMPTMLSI